MNWQDDFETKLSEGKMWEVYLKTALLTAYPDYKIEQAQDILGTGKYRQNNNKYPDFRLTLHKNKQTTLRPSRIYIDAKRKTGYISTTLPYDDFLTCDKGCLDSYNNIVQQDRDNGYDASGLLMFWHEKTGAYMAPLEPHEWYNYGPNGYGSDLAGIFYIKKLTRMHEFDDFAKEIATDITNNDPSMLEDWVDSFKKT
jgi:hypothetical protein